MQAITELPYEFTDKPVTAWGGLRLVHEMTKRMGLREALRASGLPQPGSNRGFDPVDMLEVFMACVWVGGARFSHTGLIRFDEALKQIFGWRRVAEVSTFTRFFRRFIGRWFWDQMPEQRMTLDLDSSVVTRYGEQEGVATGYNPSKRGVDAMIRCSRSPLTSGWSFTRGCGPETSAPATVRWLSPRKRWACWVIAIKSG